MNKIYKIVWSVTQQTWLVTGELGRANKKSKILSVAIIISSSVSNTQVMAANIEYTLEPGIIYNALSTVDINAQNGADEYKFITHQGTTAEQNIVNVGNDIQIYAAYGRGPSNPSPSVTAYYSYGGYGIQGDDFTLNNKGRIRGGAGYAADYSYGRAAIFGNGLIINNYDYIEGGYATGGRYYATPEQPGYGYGASAIIGNNLTIYNSNSGRITGGFSRGFGIGGNGIGGDGISGNNLIINNEGTITGGYSSDLAGNGISGSNLTINNSGSINHVNSSNSIVFTNGTNSLTLNDGSIIIGNVLLQAPDAAVTTLAIINDAATNINGNFKSDANTAIILSGKKLDVSYNTSFGENLALNSDDIALHSDTVTFNNTAISTIKNLNTTHWDNTYLYKLITTNNGISGTYSDTNVNPLLTVGAKDYAGLVIYGNDLVYGLKWGANNNDAHGTFDLRNDAVLTIATVLADNTTADKWDGKTLTKAGQGTLILEANNTYTGTSNIIGGTLKTAVVDAFANTSGVTVTSGATLNLAGNSQKMSTDATLNNAGTVRINDEGTVLTNTVVLTGNVNNTGDVIINACSSCTGQIFNVTGNWTGNNGAIYLGTVLKGDNDSKTDKLVIDGNASGTTTVIVNNVGGSGAKTIDGIELIHIGGTSTDYAFSQAGRIVAGAYDYTLVKGNTSGTDKQSWFLTNKYVPTPIDPTPEPKPVIVYRPEAASYTSNLIATNTLFNTRLHDRLGETQYTDALTGERKVTSMWMRNVVGRKLFNMADGQNKTAANGYVLQIGGDLTQWSGKGDQRFHLGLMGGYASQHSNTRNTLSGNSSKGDTRGYSTGIYGTYYQNQKDKSGLYVDSWLQYNWFDNTVHGDGQVREKYKSRGLTASLETGYSFLAGTYKTTYGMENRIYIQPKAQAVWMGVKAAEHKENNGTLVQGVGDDNVQTRLGVRLFMNGKSHLDKGTAREFEPFIEANWIYNTRQFGVRLNGVETASYGTRNVGELKAGVEGKISDNLNVWGNVAQQMGGKGYSDSQAMLGVKYIF